MDIDIRLKVLEGIVAAVEARTPDDQLAEFVRRQVELMRLSEEALALASQADRIKSKGPTQ